jgi:hypothetical protein
MIGVQIMLLCIITFAIGSSIDRALACLWAIVGLGLIAGSVLVWKGVARIPDEQS